MSAVSSQPSAVELPRARQHGSSYFEILKSTILVGGSQVITIAIGIVRTKILALLLGPSGFGLMGLFSSISEVTQAAAGLGLNSSGVRQIAASAGAADRGAIARVAATLKRTSAAAGMLGALVLAAFAGGVSKLTFGTAERGEQIGILGLAVFCGILAAGYSALIQGLRRIADLARIAVLGSLSGTALAIAFVAWLGENGVVWGLVSMAGANFACAWWFSRQVDIPRPVLDFHAFLSEARPLLGLGLAFMASALLTLGSAYGIRVLLAQRLGLEATGLYQAAWSLGGLYVSLILQAMGSDFYPRLTAVAHDDGRCNRLLNEQALMSFLVAGPGILATLLFAPSVIRLFYTPQFLEAVEILRWLCLGIAMRIVGWPLGFLLLAKGAKGMFFLSDAFWTASHLTLAMILTREFGLKGAGIAFLAAYVLQSLLNYAFARRLSGFRWSSPVLRTGTFLVLAVIAGFLLTALLPPAPATVSGSALLAATTGLAAVRLQGLLGVPLWQVSKLRRRLAASKADR